MENGLAVARGKVRKLPIEYARLSQLIRRLLVEAGEGGLQDLEVVAVEDGFDSFWQQVVWVYVSSEEFDPVPQGGKIPSIDPFEVF